MLFGNSDSRRFVLGYDLGDKVSQISYLASDADMPETLSVLAGSELYNIPTILCKRKEVNQWFYGKEATRHIEDGDGYEVKKALKNLGVDMTYLVTSDLVSTPAYIKTVFVEDGKPPVETNRHDVKNRTVTPDSLQNALIANVEALAPQVDAIILLDQLMEENCGVVTDSLLTILSEIADTYPDLLIYGDSRGFIRKFRNMIIKCNNHEALGLAGGPEEGDFDLPAVYDAMDTIRGRTGHPVFITCNKHGVAVEWDGEKKLVPAVDQTGRTLDIVGAGDACTAGIVSALAAGATRPEAAFMGNLTSGVTVRMLGQTGAAQKEKVIALFDEQFGA